MPPVRSMTVVKSAVSSGKLFQTNQGEGRGDAGKYQSRTKHDSFSIVLFVSLTAAGLLAFRYLLCAVSSLRNRAALL